MESPVFNANCVDPDQTPPSAVTDLGLQCLSVSFYGDCQNYFVSFLKCGVF